MSRRSCAQGVQGLQLEGDGSGLHLLDCIPQRRLLHRAPGCFDPLRISPSKSLELLSLSLKVLLELTSKQ